MKDLLDLRGEPLQRALQSAYVKHHTNEFAITDQVRKAFMFRLRYTGIRAVGKERKEEIKLTNLLIRG